MTNRQKFQEYISNLQEKQHQNLDEIKSQFDKHEGRLIEVIYGELTGVK